MDCRYGIPHDCHNSQAAKARQEADQQTDTAQEFEQADKVGYGEWHPHRIEESSRAFEPLTPIPAQHLLCTVSKKYELHDYSPSADCAVLALSAPAGNIKRYQTEEV